MGAAGVAELRVLAEKLSARMVAARVAEAEQNKLPMTGRYNKYFNDMECNKLL